mgnify:CR=1 FL=1
MDRKDVELKYRWKMEDVFESDEAWEAAFSELETLPDVASFRGNLNTAEKVAAYFAVTEAYEQKLMRVYLYAHSRNDEDVRVTKYSAYVAKVIGLFTKYGAAISFAEPELTALPEETLRAFAADERLKDYDYYFTRLLARKKHVLSEKEELILAQTAEPMSVSSDVFGMLDDAELNLPFMMYQGKRVKLSHGLYSVIMSGKDRDAREKAFRKYYSAYEKILGTLATAYFGNVKKDIFYKNVRGYGSCLEMALSEEDVTRDVYDNLITSVNDAAPVMHRYMQVRKKALGFDKMHMYDLYIPLVENAELRLTYEEAYELVLKGLSPLGEEYVALLEKGRDERWIDVCETEGKTSGAYSIGVFGMHPFVLLNYQQTTHDVFTIAHEMGHSIHSWFSNGTQPYAKADYKIFVAEVASTVNEVLLLKYLLRTSQDTKLRKYLLNYFMDMIRTTLFRQTQFAEFEQEAHAMAERGEPLNKDNLSELYYSLNKKYYGDALTHDKQIAIEWARIPHFYRSFYVYKYATGITAAIAIADKILSEGKPAVERYFNFLKGGCSTDPVSLLKGAGADLTQKETFAAAMKEFSDALEEFESLS